MSEEKRNRAVGVPEWMEGFTYYDSLAYVAVITLVQYRGMSAFLRFLKEVAERNEECRDDDNL